MEHELNQTQKAKLKELYHLYKKDENDYHELSSIFGSNASESNSLRILHYLPEQGLDVKVWRVIDGNCDIYSIYSISRLILMLSSVPDAFEHCVELDIDQVSMSNIFCPNLAKYHNKSPKFYRDKAKDVMDKLCPYAVLKSIT